MENERAPPNCHQLYSCRTEFGIAVFNGKPPKALPVDSPAREINKDKTVPGGLSVFNM